MFRIGFVVVVSWSARETIIPLRKKTDKGFSMSDTSDGLHEVAIIMDSYHQAEKADNRRQKKRRLLDAS